MDCTHLKWMWNETAKLINFAWTEPASETPPGNGCPHSHVRMWEGSKWPRCGFVSETKWNPGSSRSSGGGCLNPPWWLWFSPHRGGERHLLYHITVCASRYSKGNSAGKYLFTQSRSLRCLSGLGCCRSIFGFFSFLVQEKADACLLLMSRCCTTSAHHCHARSAGF